METHEHDDQCRYLGNDAWNCGTIDNEPIELHTIRPCRNVPSGTGDIRLNSCSEVVECSYGRAEFFALYRYGNNRELEFIADFPTYCDAVEFAREHKATLEPLCEGCLARPQPQIVRSDLTQLSCFGGASGEAFACPNCYYDHLLRGGDNQDDDKEIPCVECINSPVCTCDAQRLHAPFHAQGCNITLAIQAKGGKVMTPEQWAKLNA